MNRAAQFQDPIISIPREIQFTNDLPMNIILNHVNELVHILDLKPVVVFAVQRLGCFHGREGGGSYAVQEEIWQPLLGDAGIAHCRGFSNAEPKCPS